MLDERLLKQLSFWIIRLLTIIFLIFLGLRYINDIINVILKGISIISPLLIGTVIALILNIPLNIIESKIIKKNIKYKRLLSITLSLLLTIGFIVVIFVSVIPEIIEASQLIFTVISEVIDTLGSNSYNIDYPWLNNIDWANLKTTVSNWFQLQSNTIMNSLLSVVKNISNIIITLFISLMFSIYLLSSKEKLKKQLKVFLNAWIPKRISEPILYITRVFNKTFQNYIVSQLTEACILGVLCTIGMFILQIPYAGISGALVGVTALIPYIGAFIGAGISAILICAIEPFKAFMFIIYIVILQQIEGNIIYPKVVGAKLKLPSIWIFIAIVIGGNIAGPIGMILSVPIIASLYIIIKETTHKRYSLMHKEEQL